MTESVIVHRAVVSETAARWQIECEAEASIDAVYKTPPSAFETSGDPGVSRTTFSAVDGLAGALVVDPAIVPDAANGAEFFASRHASSIPLQGPSNDLLVAIHASYPALEGEIVDSPDPQSWFFRHDRVSSGFFRMKAFPSVLLLGEFVLEESERIIDLERYNEMQVPAWLELSGATGLELTEIWRHDY